MTRNKFLGKGQKKAANKKFEEEYFEGWFKHAVGSFSASDLELSRRWFWAWLRKLDQYVPVADGEGKKVLEIGCSIGGVASLLSERGFEVYASDISKYAIAKAKKLSPGINFSVFDVQKKIPLKGKFDLIIAFEVVEHLEKPDLAIKNMFSSLKEGGFLVFSSPYPYHWIYRDPTHINVKYPKAWLKMMKSAGLKKVKFYRFSLLPFFYRFSKFFHFIFPFPVPLSFINSPIFYIGKK